MDMNSGQGLETCIHGHRGHLNYHCQVTALVLSDGRVVLSASHEHPPRRLDFEIRRRQCSHLSNLDDNRIGLFIMHFCIMDNGAPVLYILCGNPTTDICNNIWRYIMRIAPESVENWKIIIIDYNTALINLNNPMSVQTSSQQIQPPNAVYIFETPHRDIISRPQISATSTLRASHLGPVSRTQSDTTSTMPGSYFDTISRTQTDTSTIRASHLGAIPRIQRNAVASTSNVSHLGASECIPSSPFTSSTTSSVTLQNTLINNNNYDDSSSSSSDDIDFGDDSDLEDLNIYGQLEHLEFPSDREAIEDEPTCCSCLTNRARVTLHPCRHECLCMRCKAGKDILDNYNRRSNRRFQPTCPQCTRTIDGVSERASTPPLRDIFIDVINNQYYNDMSISDRPIYSQLDKFNFPQDREAIVGEQICCICLTNIAQVTLSPCQHKCFCFRCKAGYDIIVRLKRITNPLFRSTCPICRATIIE